MVKVYAPMLSLDASGTLGEAIVFSKWKGRNYVRQRVIPANPQSGLQVSMRAMMKFLAQNWAALSSAQKADWESRADDMIVSPFNAFVSYNQKRWRNYTLPSIADPATAAGTLAATSGHAATGGERSITLDWTVDTLNDGWGMVLLRGTAGGFAKVISAVKAVVLSNVAQAESYVDSPLDPGTYYYGFRNFTDDGVFSGAIAEVNATAT